MAKQQDDDSQEDTKEVTKTKSTAKSSKKKGLTGGQIAALALLVIVLIGIVLYLLYGALPVLVVSKVLSSGNLNGQTLKAILFQDVNASPQFATSYSGNVSFNGQDPNIHITFLKYYNDTRVTYNLQDIPFMGTGIITVINSTNDSSLNEICVPTSISLFSTRSLSSNAVYYCANSSSSNYDLLVDRLDGVLNITAIRNFHTNSYGVGIYNLQPCYTISGAGNIEFNRDLVNESGVVNSTLEFTTCLSARYNIPVWIRGNLTFPDAQGNTNDTIAFNIVQASLNKSTTKGQVLQIPVGG